ncbi:MAG: hypothetical protein E7347_04695 [Clostridiales bacterium]|nr:hypothetical protein [Clostridiales bacterium]
MKKLVVRTIWITLASVLGAFVIAFGATAIFAPDLMGRAFDGVGNYSASVFFYEKQYEKTGDIDDLDVLVSKINIKKDSSRAVKYFGKMVEREDFDAFCNSQNNGSNMSAKEYYCGYYALSLAYNGKSSQAITYAQSFVNDNSYTEFNPLRMLVLDYAQQASQTEIESLENAINSVSNFSAEQVVFINADISTLNDLKN